MEKTVREYCNEIKDEIIAIRRDIHAHPETGLNCSRTTDLICRKLEENGIGYVRLPQEGLYADIKGEKNESDHMIMLRSDMDALNIEEKTGLPYASKINGKMHACGHDIHTSMMIGTAIILNKLKKEFSGTVRLLFQPGEEDADGAKYMISNGVLGGVEMGFGMHCDPLKPVRTIGVRNGADWAALDYFKLKLIGRSAHGATPHQGKDALVGGSELVMRLQSLVSGDDDAVLTIGRFSSGTAYNVIAGEALLEGTIRFFDEEFGKDLPEAFERTVKETCEKYGLKYELFYDRNCQAVVNDDKACEIVRKAAEKVLDKPEDLLESEKELISEDFSQYSSRIPCVFVHLGTDGGHPLHNNQVCFKEDSVETGMAVEVQFSLDALEYLNNR